MAGMRQTAGQPRALGDVGPALLSGCHLQPEPRLLLKNYYPDTCVFSKVFFFLNMLRRISSQTFTFLKVSGSLIYAV